MLWYRASSQWQVQCHRAITLAVDEGVRLHCQSRSGHPGLEAMEKEGWPMDLRIGFDGCRGRRSRCGGGPISRCPCVTPWHPRMSRQHVPHREQQRHPQCSRSRAGIRQSKGFYAPLRWWKLMACSPRIFVSCLKAWHAVQVSSAELEAQYGNPFCSGGNFS